MHYLGEKGEPSTRIDVFINENAIGKPYTLIGKGSLGKGFPLSPEKLQTLAMKKGMEVGADGVLIQEYYVPNNGTSITTTQSTDSVGKGTVSGSTTVIQPLAYTGYQVYFLRYK